MLLLCGQGMINLLVARFACKGTKIFRYRQFYNDAIVVFILLYYFCKRFCYSNGIALRVVFSE